MSTEKPVDRTGAGNGVQRVVGSTRFWLGTIVYLSALTLLVLWLDLGGGFSDWMRPVIYLALGVSFTIAMKTFLRLRRSNRNGDR